MINFNNYSLPTRSFTFYFLSTLFSVLLVLSYRSNAQDLYTFLMTTEEFVRSGYFYFLQHSLLILLAFSLFGLFCCFAVPVENVKYVALITSLVLLVFTVWLTMYYEPLSFEFQFQSTLIEINAYSLALSFGIDGISLCFLLLTVIIFPICFIASWQISYLTRQFFIILLTLEILLILTFITTDIFFFYVFFESILVPMFLMIGIWGSRTRKIKAAYYFFLYTLFGSLFMLFGLIYMYSITGSANYEIILNYEFTLIEEYILWCCFFVTFAAKIPMFPFHLWLPEAHVEAPTIGSVILASLLLKLGGYGFIRISLSMLPNASHFFIDLVTALALISIVYASLTTIRQIDLKKIIAYSSIAHMNLLVLGIFSFNVQGIDGAIYLMVAHGVVSSALFFCVGVLYDRWHTRLLKYFSGLVQVMPFFTIFFFLFTMANMGFPGTSNFVGELLVLVGIFQYNTIALFFAATGIVLSAVYSIWLFNRVCFGTLKIKYITSYIDLNEVEMIVFIPLIILMFILGLNSQLIIDLFSAETAFIAGNSLTH